MAVVDDLAVVVGATAPHVDAPVLATRFPVARTARALVALRGVGDLVAIATALVVSGPTGQHVAYSVAAALALAATGTSRHRPLVPSALDDVARIGASCGAALLPFAVAAAWPLAGSLVAHASVTAVLVCLAHAAAGVTIRRARRHEHLREPAVIVGAGRVGVELYRSLIDHPEYGLTPLGIVDDLPRPEPLPVIGNLHDLPQLVTAMGVRHVIVAFGRTLDEEALAVLRLSMQLDVEVYVVPRYFELGVLGGRCGLDEVWGIPLERLRPVATRRSAWHAKRGVDVTIASVALILAAPLFAALALAVRLSSPGPVLFRQRRVSQHGRPFELLKFRTMVSNDHETWWVASDDARVTPVGRWMRRLSLDELPQLWNVVRGDMSLVGPRPERPYFAARYASDVARYDDRHRVPAGLTGLAQVNGLRGDTSIAHRARFDNAYIERWSLWTDVKILVRTAGELLRHARSRG